MAGMAGMAAGDPTTTPDRAGRVRRQASAASSGTLRHGRGAGAATVRGEVRMDEGGVGREATPTCRRCGQGDLAPLSDLGTQGAEVRYKAWVCTHPGCAFTLTIRNGEVVRGEPVTDPSTSGRPAPPPLPGPRPLGLVPGKGPDGGGRAR